MKPEEKARQNIDNLLEAAGWTIQDFKDLNLGASLGVAEIVENLEAALDQFWGIAESLARR